MRQRHIRVNLKNRVGLYWRGISTPAKLENISATGALVRANLQVKVGDFMSMHLEDKSWPGAMDMGAEVTRLVHPWDGMPIFALDFLKVPETLRVFLRHTLAKHNSTLESHGKVT